MLDRIKRNFHSEGFRELSVRICICLIGGVLFELMRKNGGNENLAGLAACGFIIVVLGIRAIVGWSKKQ